MKFRNLLLLVGCITLTGCSNITPGAFSSKGIFSVSKKNIEVISTNIVGMNDDGTVLVEVLQQDKDIEYPVPETVYYTVDTEENVLHLYTGLEELSIFRGGHAIAKVMVEDPDPSKKGETEHYGLLSMSGEWVAEPNYASVSTSNGNFYCFRERIYDDYGYLYDRNITYTYKGHYLTDDESLNLPNNYMKDVEHVLSDNKIYTVDGDIIDLGDKLAGYSDNIRWEYGNIILTKETEGVPDSYTVLTKSGEMIEYSDDKCNVNPANNSYWLRVFKEYSFFGISKWELESITYYVNGEPTEASFGEAPIINYLGHNVTSLMFPEGDKYYYMLDENGNYFHNAYYEIEPFNSKGYTFAKSIRKDGSSGFWCLINTKGVEILDSSYKILDFLKRDSTITVRDENGEEQTKLIDLHADLEANVEQAIIDIDVLTTNIISSITK